MNRYVISWHRLIWSVLINLCTRINHLHSSPLSACQSSFDHTKTSSLIKEKCPQPQVLKIQRCINLLLTIFSTTRSLDQLQVSYSQVAVTFSLWLPGKMGPKFWIIPFHYFFLLFILKKGRGQCGEGNGNPLRYSCLENPMDGGAWWAAVHRVTKSRTPTERLCFHFSLSCIGEGNGNPLQYSCLENPRDGGAWWAAIYGVAQSWTRLKWLSSSSRGQCRPLLYRQWIHTHNKSYEYIIFLFVFHK